MKIRVVIEAWEDDVRMDGEAPDDIIDVPEGLDWDRAALHALMRVCEIVQRRLPGDSTDRRHD